MSDELTELRNSIAAFVQDPESGAFDELARRAEAIETTTTSSAPLGRLDRAALDASWSRYCLSPPNHPLILALAPADEDDGPDLTAASVEHLIERWGHTDSLAPLRSRRLDAKQTRGFFAARQRDGQPVLVVAKTALLDQLVSSLERFDLRFRLSSASVVVEIVDASTTTGTADNPNLRSRASEYLAIPTGRMLRQLQLGSTATPLITGPLGEGDPEVFVAPHWVRTSLFDPDTGQPVEPSDAGQLRLFDLANLDRGIRVDTDLYGRLEADGFRPLPRS